MAFATAFSDNPALCAPETRAVFASCAKQWLDEEFKDPAMSLVRALALLAEYHCGVGEMNTGYMYMGMSFRAVQILATKSDTEPDQGLNPFPVSITTDWLFWSAYCYDKLMALEFDRAYDLPVSHPATPPPSTDHGIDSQPWLTEPYSTPPTTAAAPPNLITETFHQTSKLMLIGTEIIELTCHLQEDTALEEHTVINIHLQLDTWFNALPEPLLVWARSSAPLPHIISLHIVYWRFILLLHQTQYPKAPVNTGYPPQDPTQAQKMPIADLSIKMCDRAVHKIVQLVKMFDDRHGLKFFPRSLVETVFACGVGLLREYTASPYGANKKRGTALDGVTACIGSLRTISGTWPCATPRADELQTMLQVVQPPQSVAQVDGPSTMFPEVDLDLDDASHAFYQFMRERRGAVSSGGGGGGQESESEWSELYGEPVGRDVGMGEAQG
ncbi:hypothetical protein FRC12_020911 [Ceratobasidium sp. 428]|nr:hypothetical protein FRC12_020911 [Ceratobasidium sp. 428]